MIIMHISTLFPLNETFYDDDDIISSIVPLTVIRKAHFCIIPSLT